MVRHFNCLDVGCSGNLRVKPSDMSLPVMDTLRWLEIYEYGRVMTEKETESMLQYSAMCVCLEKVQFSVCLLPRYIKVTYQMSGLKERHVSVNWYTGSRFYRLNLVSGQWEGEWCDYAPMTDEQYQEEVEVVQKRKEEWEQWLEKP